MIKNYLTLSLHIKCRDKGKCLKKYLIVRILDICIEMQEYSSLCKIRERLSFFTNIQSFISIFFIIISNLVE